MLSVWNIAGEEIPADLDCREAHDPVTYGRIHLDVSERLLPSAAKLVVVSRVGRESRNSIAFSSCRHYTASLSFDTTSDPTIPAQQHPQLELPAGVKLVLRLEQPISIGVAAAADELVARLDKAVGSGRV